MYRIEITVGSKGKNILEFLTATLNSVLELLKLADLDVAGVVLINPKFEDNEDSGFTAFSHEELNNV